MDLKERAALIDFVASVIWPGRTLRTTVASEQDFTLSQTWDSSHDYPMAWVDGNRVTDSITWLSDTQVRLPAAVAAGKQVLILIAPGTGAGYFPRNSWGDPGDPTGDAPILSDVDCNNFRLRRLHPSVDPTDAVQRQEVEQIVAALTGGNFVLKTGDTMTGPLVVPDATLADQAVNKGQVVLLDGSQVLTAELRGVNASSATGLTTKQQMEAADAAVTASLRTPNRRTIYTTPGSNTWAVPAGVTKVWLRLRGGGGGGGGGIRASANPSGYIGGAGASGGRVSVAMTVTPLQNLNLVIGGGGYGAAGHDGQSGSGGAGGGGGGSGSRVEQNGNYVVAGGGGGGGGTSVEDAAGGAGGPGGYAGNSSAGAGGAAGTGGITTDGGAGGPGAISANAGAGSAGSGSASPVAILSTYDESWAFGDAGNGPDADGGAGGYGGPAGATAPASNGGNGGHGSIEIRWYQA